MNGEDVMNSLTWKELSEVEDYIGAGMDEWANLTKKSKVAFCMQYILAKRIKPELTIEMAENLSIKELSDLAGVELVDSPKEDSQP